MTRLPMYYFGLFLSGFVCFGIEILGFRILAPHCGNTLPVWINIIAVVLLGYFFGFYAGGKFASRFNKPDYFFMVILGIGGLTGLLYFLITPVASLISQLAPGNLASFLIGLVLFFPVVFLHSFLNPYFLNLTQAQSSQLSVAASYSFFFSSAGNVLGVLGSEFVFIPLVGLKQSLICFTVVLVLYGVLGYWYVAHED